MGWFWNSSSSSGDDKPNDTFSHLRPETREFLEREAPIPPSAAAASLPSSSTSSSSSTTAKPAEDNASKYSKYGTKYADIWAQYRPLEEIEAEARTPSMAVNDVYQSYKDRKAAITRAALENCCFEQEVLLRCQQTGTKFLLGGCTEESSEVERCFKGQQEFLRQLGYMSVVGRSEDVEDGIQMHADRLWREQRQKEKEIMEKE